MRKYIPDQELSAHRLLSDSSSFVPDDLNHLALVLVQESQESWLKWNSRNPHKFGIDVYTLQ